MRNDFDLLHPSELASRDVQDWNALQTANPAFSNPLLSPQFAQAVGALRSDARVAIWRQDGTSAGFFAFHRRPSAFARPIGAPFSDLQGPVSRADASLGRGEILGAAGIRALKVNGLVDPYGLMSAGLQGESVSRRIVLDGDAGQYLDALRAHSRNGAKNFRRYSQRLEQDLGALSFKGPDRDRASLDRLFAWKSRQLRDSGLHDYFAVDWIGRLLHRLFDAREGGFEGMMLNLYAGDRHVAGQFGVRLNGHFHPWIGAMDPGLKAYSPGSLFQWMAVQAMPDLGLTTYELGEGEGQWKKQFALQSLTVRTGMATACTPTSLIGAARERLYGWQTQQSGGLGRIQRRLDQIAATELTLAGRTRGVISALSNFEKRNAVRLATATGGNA